jgi:hypothetical protein
MILSSGQPQVQLMPPNRWVCVRLRSRPRVADYQPELRRVPAVVTPSGTLPKMVTKPMPERHVALHRSRSAAATKPSRSPEELPASADALDSRPTAAKVVPGWLLGAAPLVKSRPRQVVNPDIGLAVGMRRALLQTAAHGG